MFRTRILQPEVDYKTGRVIARHEILEGNYREFYDVANKEKEYDISIKRHYNRRSLDANAYYHVLIRKIAKALDTSEAEVKNATLGRYGQLEIDSEGRPIELSIPDNVAVEKSPTLHLLPTTEIEYKHGKVYRWYRLLRGSKSLNRSEMYHLIQGTISDARDAGLTEAEIMTPTEREILGQVYGMKL